MPGISNTLVKLLQEALSECGPFDSNENVKHVFTNKLISPWKNKLPEHNSRDGRVNAVIHFLHDKYRSTGENVLVLFLRVISEDIDPHDACHQRLKNIADMLEQETQNAEDKAGKIKVKNGSKKIKILFLAANPSDTVRLNLEKESRAIEHALRQSEYGAYFEILKYFAVQVSDIQGCLLQHKPDIVHFSGHGIKSDEIIMEDDSGNSCPVSVRALSSLFSVLKDNIRCVVLNACYSENQARAIAEHIDCVIGMSEEIGDLAAISFASSFYQALGFGRDVKTAFDSGCVQIDLEGLNEQDKPKLKALNINPQDIVFARND